MRIRHVVPPLLMVSCISVAGACPMDLPDAYVPFGLEARVLDMPEASFYHELSVMLGQTQDIDAWWPSTGREHSKDTFSTDVHDLRESLGGASESDGIVAAYSSMRGIMNAYSLPQVRPTGDSLSSTRPGLDSQSEGPSGTSYDLSRYEDLLARIPTEFALYVRGAAAYHRRDFDAARAHWRTLLELPQSERTYRSTWASYMIGKSLMRDNPEEAVAAFEQTRTFATLGLKDSLSLAPDSFGWQAMAETSLGRMADAIRHYADMFLNGPVNVRIAGYRSLRILCARSTTSPEVLPQLAGDPVCRRIMTAWIIANRYDAESKAWLKTVAAHAGTGLI